MAWRIGVNSGGTFTDICLFDEGTGRVAVWKVASTPADPSHAVAQEVARLSPESPPGQATSLISAMGQRSRRMR